MRPFILRPLLLLLLLAGCSQPAATPPLAGARLGGPFALTDQNGRTVRDSDFDGRYRLIYFGYSYCPDVCPTDLQSMGRGLALFEKKDSKLAGQVQPIFITVDPQRDTPAVLKDYVAAFHPRLIGLTGPDERLDKVKKDFAIYSARQGAGPDYLVDHSRQMMLFGPKGEPIVLVPSDQGAQAVATTLETWVR